MSGILALHWPAFSHHLLTAVLPEIARLPITPGETAVAVVERIAGYKPSPRLALLHIDASTPGDFVTDFRQLGPLLEAQGTVLWNGRVADIRKRSLQRSLMRLGLPATLARRDGPASERVIVKTNLNSHGSAERRASVQELAALGWQDRPVSPLGQHDYLVMTRDELPENWWADDRLSIERYIDNSLGLFYRAYLVGPQVVLCEGRAPGPLRRLRDAAHRYDFLLDRAAAVDPLLDLLLPSPAIDAFRSAVVYAQAFGLDYGSLDLMVDDAGIPFIVDVNLTPYWGRVPGAQMMLRHLRHGLAQA